MLAPYPQEFFVAHRLYRGFSFPPEGVWGDIGDGPLPTQDDLTECLLEALRFDDLFKIEDRLRVWKITPDSPAQDLTSEMIQQIQIKREES